MTGRARRLAKMPRTSFVVPAVGALGGVAFCAWKPGVALSTFASPRALGFVASVGILTLALGWVLPRLGRGFAVTAAAQAVPLVIAFVITVLPAFRTVTVNDPLPGVAAALPAASGAPRTAVPPVSTATRLSRGALSGIDHRASGDAALIRLADGSQLIRLESLDVEPGPDYFVFVVPGAGRRSPDGGTRLSHLRGNRGNQNYPIPAGIAVTRPVTVLIWCRAFAVPVAAATLR